jgi:TPR repeat protein
MRLQNEAFLRRYAMNRLSLLTIFTGLVAALGMPTACRAGGAHIVGAGPSGVCRQTSGPSDGNFLPGKYWEEEAEDRRYHDNFSGALEAYKHAAYYGNRDALYDIAMMYLKGAKNVSADVPLGIAWLHVAVEYNHTLSTTALRRLEPALSPDERDRSVREFAVLAEKYNVATTRNRVMKTYQLERGHIGFADWICRDGMAMPRDTYVAEIEQEFVNYVTTMFGTVTVEPIQPIEPANDKK